MLLTIIFWWGLASAQENTDFFKRDTTEIHESLQAASMPLADWIQSLNSTPYDLLCLGETHEDFFREFYSGVIKDLSFQKLAIETTQEEWVKIQESWKLNKEAKLLNTNFAPIFQVIDSKLPKISVLPVEATTEQDRLESLYTLETGKAHLSRDGFIAKNILKDMVSQEKIVALYGRLHCSKNNTGLGSVPFVNFLAKSKKVLSVMVIKRRGTEKPNPLVTYLDGGAEGTKPVLVVDASKLKDEDYNFHWEIKSILDNFDYVIVY